MTRVHPLSKGRPEDVAGEIAARMNKEQSRRAVAREP
jgi:hypothetical protein